jgi:predicted Rossmann fold flavoprotein
LLNKNKSLSQRQIIVIGAGAAGLMAAGQAAYHGASVLLLEKMPTPGRKLKMTGHGRCNLTHTTSIPDFISHFGTNGVFLRQAFHQFFYQELINFFKDLGVQTLVEPDGRVFPTSNNAQDIVTALLTRLERLGVVLATDASVSKINVENNCVVGVGASIKNSQSLNWRHVNNNYYAEAVIIATGGCSYPATGSTGDGYRLAQSVGHTIAPIRPALVPLKTTGTIAQRLQGLSLNDVAIRVVADGQKVIEGSGEMLFTHFGVSGPLILKLSKYIVELLERHAEVILNIDLQPCLNDNELDQLLREMIDKYGKKQFKNLLADLLQPKLIPICIEFVGMPAEKPCHQLTSLERGQFRHWLKNFKIKISGHRSFKEAFVTAGGVSLKDVDPRTMQSRIVNELYFAGEVIDIDADTGGYNLQSAFSTGWVAGQAAVKGL